MGSARKRRVPSFEDKDVDEGGDEGHAGVTGEGKETKLESLKVKKPKLTPKTDPDPRTQPALEPRSRVALRPKPRPRPKSASNTASTSRLSTDSTMLNTGVNPKPMATDQDRKADEGSSPRPTGIHASSPARPVAAPVPSTSKNKPTLSTSKSKPTPTASNAKASVKAHAYTKHPTHWHLDGSLLVELEGVRYRLHRSRMVAISGVVREVLDGSYLNGEGKAKGKAKEREREGGRKGGRVRVEYEEDGTPLVFLDGVVGRTDWETLVDAMDEAV